MKITSLAISDVLLIEPKIFTDDRGFFFESFNQKIFEDFAGKKINFVQDNHSKSRNGVLRGLHYQTPPRAQGKLVRVIQGEIYDVVVDLRKSSSTFGKWVGETLSAENKKQIWVPEGFAHGFVTLSEHSEVLYKASDFYSPAYEQCLIWSDPEINITWPYTQNVYTISDKDIKGKPLSMLTLFS